MKNIKSKERNQLNLDDIDTSFRLKGALTPKRQISEATNIFERLGFTTSIDSIVSDLENDGDIQVLSPLSPSGNSGAITTPTKFGAISNQALNQTELDPSFRRMKFINNTLLRLLLLAIIINFVLIFVI